MSRDGIKVSDIDALLREIEDANSADVVGTKSSSAVGTTTVTTTTSGGSAFMTEDQKRRAAVDEAARRASAAVSFSTYVPPPSEVIEATAEKVPQGGKLAPMGGGGGIGVGNTNSTTASSLAAAPPLGAKGAAMTVDPAAIAAAVRKAKGITADDYAATDGNSPNRQQGRRSSVSQGQYDDQHDYTTQPPHIVNFLPVMHARLMSHVGGIQPKARWGHTMTAVGDALYLFGGTTADGMSTNDMFQYLPKHSSFEPVHIRGDTTSGNHAVIGADSNNNTNDNGSAPRRRASISLTRLDPPTARCHHSAVSYQDRYLVIFGGSAERGTVLLNDVHIYDTRDQIWRHVPHAAKDSSAAKHEPTGRFGHSAVVVGSKMYVFGGRCIKRGTAGADGAPATSSSNTTPTVVLGNDVYVFCLESFSWKKRIHISNDADTTGAEGGASAATAKSKPTTATSNTPVPPKRFHHGACAIGTVMYIHGGEGAAGQYQADTWALDTITRQWRLVHNAHDSIPRTRHALFGCGEAIMAVGGVSAEGPSKQVPLAVLAVMETDPSTGVSSILPQQAMHGWIPVSLGAANANTIPANKKSFGAASHNGFVYTFGGVTAGGQPTNDLIRCLAMDGVPIASEPFAALQAQMRNLRQDKAFVDLYFEGIIGDATDAADGSDHHHHAGATTNTAAAARIGCHRLILQQRAPKFYADILTCKSEQVYSDGQSVGTTSSSGDASLAPTATVPSYIIAGNSRVKGIAVPFTPSAFRWFLDYLYTATVPMGSLAESDITEADVALLRQAADKYELTSLAAYLAVFGAASSSDAATTALALRKVHQELPDLLASLLESTTGATATIIFEDTDTHIDTSYAAHPLLLCNASDYFRQILRPVIADGKPSHQSRGVTARRMEGVAGKRGLIVGKVPIPRLGVKHLMRYLYTRELTVPPEDALLTMIAANTLGLADLQAHCESIVAREEVNYDTACAYITLAHTHKAPLLSELSVLTAALGFFEPNLHMAESIPFVHLPKLTQATITAVAAQLQGKWAPPPETNVTVQQDAAVYKHRLQSGSAAGYNASLSVSPMR